MLRVRGDEQWLQDYIKRAGSPQRPLGSPERVRPPVLDRLDVQVPELANVNDIIGGSRTGGRRSFRALTWILVVLVSMVAVIVAEALVWALAPVDTRGLTPFGKVLVQGERHAVLAMHHPTGGVVDTHHQTAGATDRYAPPSSHTWTHRHPVTAQPVPAQQDPGAMPPTTPPPSGQTTSGTGGGQASASTGVSPLSPASHAYLCWIERTPRGVDGC
jgi:hypothetical protein